MKMGNKPKMEEDSSYSDDSDELNRESKKKSKRERLASEALTGLGNGEQNMLNQNQNLSLTDLSNNNLGLNSNLIPNTQPMLEDMEFNVEGEDDEGLGMDKKKKEEKECNKSN